MRIIKLNSFYDFYLYPKLQIGKIGWKMLYQTTFRNRKIGYKNREFIKFISLIIVLMLCTILFLIVGYILIGYYNDDLKFISGIVLFAISVILLMLKSCLIIGGQQYRSDNRATEIKSLTTSTKELSEQASESVRFLRKEYETEKLLRMFSLVFWEKRMEIGHLGDLGTKKSIKALQNISQKASLRNYQKLAKKIIKLIAEEHDFYEPQMFLRNIFDENSIDIPKDELAQLKETSFSLLEKTLKSDPIKQIINKTKGLFFSGLLLNLTGMVLLIIGYATTLNNSSIIITIGFCGFGFGFFGIIVSIFLGRTIYPSLHKIKKYQKQKNTKALMKYLENPIDDIIGYLLAMAVLADLGVEDAIEPLTEILQSNKTSKKLKTYVRDALCVMATKLGYKDQFHLLQKTGYAEEALEIATPTEIYYIEELQSKPTGMISGLELDFEKNDILACPFCRRLAKKELFLEWLKEKPLCPVCHRKLWPDQCLIVKLEI